MTGGLAALRLTPPTGYSSLRHVGVALRSDAGHAGVLHREKQSVRLLEICEHASLRDEPPTPGYGWIEPRVPEIRARLIAGMCRLIAKQYSASGLPYGFKYDATRFSAQGDLLRGSGESGLTCATVVLAIFASNGYALLDIATWPTASERDRAFQSRMIARIAEKDPPHAAALKSELGTKRFQPSDVTAAVSLPSAAWPAKFDDVAALAADVEQRVAAATG